MQGTHTNENKRYAVLFVDDEQKSLKYFNRFYRDDFRILTADNVDEGQRILEREGEEVAVVITDQRMPNGEGTELLRFARERFPLTVRMLTSAYTDFAAVVSAINEGETLRFVEKPWARDKLRDELADGVKLYEERLRERGLLEKRREAMLSLAGNIAHELRSTLLGINAATSNIAHFLPTLLDAYEIALDQAGGSDPVKLPNRGWTRRNVEFTLESIEVMLSEANLAIDMLLANARKGFVDPADFESLSARECIERALERYPLQDHQRARVKPVEGEEFYFGGVRLLFDLVIFNLLRNAVHAVSAANGGEIQITLEPGVEAHRVRFRDSGCGIAAETLPYIFDEFFSKRSTKEANGLGLPFCRRVLEGFGGGIECVSEEGGFTEFVLTLPRVKN